MKTPNGGSHSAVLEVENSEGERFTEADCPSRIKETINRAVARGQRVGVVYGGGSRWQWTTSSSADEVILEFERAGQVVERYAVDWQTWQAFKIVAARNGRSAQEYLTIVLGVGMAEGESIQEMISWLFSVSGKKEDAAA